jgi:hypothetical protein
VTPRIAEEHALQHLLRDAQMPGVADEVGAVFALAGAAKGHVVAQDVVLGTVSTHDRGEGLVRLLAARRIGQFDIADDLPADDLLLLVLGKPSPRLHLMQIHLHHHVAPAGEFLILTADQRGCADFVPGRIGCAIDEAKEIAGVEIAKARHLVGHRHAAAQLVQQQALEFKAEVLALGPDMSRAWPARCASRP